MLRTLQATLVTLFFAVMMFLLFRDHVLPNWHRGGGIDVDRNVLTDSWSNQDEFMLIKLDDMELGAMRSTAEYDSAGDFYTVSGQVQLKTPLFSARILTAAKLNHRLEVESGRLRANVPGFGKQPLGAKELDADELPADTYEALALIRNQVLHLAVRHDDAARFQELRLARPVTMAETLLPIFRGQMLTKGVTYAVDVFDPLWGNKAGKVEVQYVDDEIENIDGEAKFIKRIEMRMGGTQSTLWVDEQGVVQRREFPLFPAKTDAASGASSSGSHLILERLDPIKARERFPELDYVPEPPKVTMKEVTGEDHGELMRRTSIFSVLTSGLQDKLLN